jgi:hypothetical protein
VTVDGRGLGDVFIDDTLTQVVDLPGSDNVLRGERAVLLAVHILARPLLPQEPIPREAMAALLKLLAEAGMQETKTMLGWFLNFRTLVISLPDSKAIAGQMRSSYRIQ